MANKRVLIISGSPQGLSAQFLQTMAAQVGWIIAADSGANWAQRAGIYPDVLVGDGDSIDPAVAEAFAQAQVQSISVPSDKDFSDLDLALVVAADLVKHYGDTKHPDTENHRAAFDSQQSAAKEEDSSQAPNSLSPPVPVHYSALLLLCNVLGARADHELATLGSLARFTQGNPDLPAPLIMQEDCIATILSADSIEPSAPQLVSSLSNQDFTLNTKHSTCSAAPLTQHNSSRSAPNTIPNITVTRNSESACMELRGFANVGQTLSLIPLLGPARLSTWGLRWNLDNAELEALSSLGVSNLVDSDDARLRLYNGNLLVLAPRLTL